MPRASAQDIPRVGFEKHRPLLEQYGRRFRTAALTFRARLGAALKSATHETTGAGGMSHAGCPWCIELLRIARTRDNSRVVLIGRRAARML